MQQPVYRRFHGNSCLLVELERAIHRPIWVMDWRVFRRARMRYRSSRVSCRYFKNVLLFLREQYIPNIANLLYWTTSLYFLRKRALPTTFMFWLRGDFINKYEILLERSKTKHKEVMKKMKHLSKMTKPHFDAIVHKYHEEVFSEIDCTECGLCCRNLGPVFRNTDIKHICSKIGLNVNDFHDKYLVQDPDGVGFMLRELPCPFQEPDNKCSIYDVRTLSCIVCPHTESVNIQKKLVGLALDSQFCPAAFMICERIIADY